MKAGATKCVTQRVKKIPGVGPPAGSPEYTRTWSIALRTMTAPRIKSIDATRDVEARGALIAANMARRGIPRKSQSRLDGPTLRPGNANLALRFGFALPPPAPP